MLKDIQVTGQKDTRSGFGDGMTELGRKNPNVVVLTADLAGSLKIHPFIKENPDRFVQCGIAEANMIGIAAGLTIGGKIPFTTTFANFSTGRVYDQIRQSVAYSGKNVKICASHAGLTLGEDGATHQILEDIGLMKMLPGMTVIVPCDYSQTKAATLAIDGDDRQGPLIATAFHGRRQALTDGAILKAFAAHPLLSLAVLAAIHLEAVKLLLKGLKLRGGVPAPADPVTIQR